MNSPAPLFCAPRALATFQALPSAPGVGRQVAIPALNFEFQPQQFAPRVFMRLFARVGGTGNFRENAGELFLRGKTRDGELRLMFLVGTALSWHGVYHHARGVPCRVTRD
jgi:hypothetical protein